VGASWIPCTSVGKSDSKKGEGIERGGDPGGLCSNGQFRQDQEEQREDLDNYSGQHWGCQSSVFSIMGKYLSTGRSPNLGRRKGRFLYKYCEQRVSIPLWKKKRKRRRSTLTNLKLNRGDCFTNKFLSSASEERGQGFFYVF